MAAPVIVGTGTTASAAATSVAVTAPTGTQVGDHQLIFVGLHSNTETVTTPTDCVQIGTTIANTEGGSGTPFNLRVFYTATVTGSITVSKSSTAPFVLGRVTYRGGSTPIAGASFSATASNSTTRTFGTSTTTVADSLVISAAFESSSAGTGSPYTTTGFSERIDVGPRPGGTIYTSLAVVDIVKAVPGTQSGSITSARSDWYVTLSVILPGGEVPTVDAGANATIDQYDTFSRTATEDDGGSAITSRVWTVQSGPNQVGATIGTAAALSWAPTVGHATTPYVIRYTATNAIGSGFDEINVTVNPLSFPVTAALKLTGNRTVSKNITASRTANLVLTGTETASKDVPAPVTAPIQLAGSATGTRIYMVTANLKLTGAAINVGRPGASSPLAALKLSGAAINTSRTTPDVPVSGDLQLQGNTVTQSTRNNVSDIASIVLTGTETAFKNVSSSHTAPITLSGSVSGTDHDSIANAVANLVLDGAAINTSSVHNNTPVSALLRLTGTSATSSVRFNRNVSGNIRLIGTAFGQRIIEAVAGGLPPRADTTTKYELVVVARIPQAATAPLLLEVDALDWSGITWTEELNAIPSLAVSVSIGSMTENILQRLRKPDELPTELWLFRNGKHVFAGPLLGFTARDEESVTLQAQGILVYTKMWFLFSDRVYDGHDQFAIVKDLIDYWQVGEYGNFGIITEGVGTSGITRIINYKYKDGHVIYNKINELSKMTNGFDISIDPARRTLQLFFPQQGVDRSIGEDRIVFDARNVTSSNITCSVAPGDLISDAVAFGTGTGQNEVFSSYFFNTQRRVRYGRTGIVSSIGQVASQGMINDYALALLRAREDALLIPGPSARVSVDSDISSYDVGDTVDYQLHSQLQVSGAYRIRKRSVRVTKTGTETVSIEFV
jgi:hypothetical protein